MIYVLIAVVIVVIIIGIIAVRNVSASSSYSRRAVSPKEYGEQGERRVANILGDTVIGEQYLINNLRFADKYGRTHEIDHIYINRAGIWIIETKNWAGRVFGEDNWKEWTQIKDYNDEKKKLQNPVKQNRAHIDRLSEVLNINEILHNVVVFLERADISGVHSKYVYSIYELKAIKTANTGIVLSADKMQGYYDRLIKLKNNCNISEEEHVRNIQHTQSQIAQGICPRCGGRLVLRNGKNGQFYGCSNFPKCKFTKNKD